MTTHSMCLCECVCVWILFVFSTLWPNRITSNLKMNFGIVDNKIQLNPFTCSFSLSFYHSLLPLRLSPCHSVNLSIQFCLHLNAWINMTSDALNWFQIRTRVFIIFREQESVWDIIFSLHQWIMFTEYMEISVFEMSNNQIYFEI